jgi:hypothetical protein
MKFPPPPRGIRLDRESWEKGFSDGERGSVWWPGTGIEPLSYATGYLDGKGERDRNWDERAQGTAARSSS